MALNRRDFLTIAGTVGAWSILKPQNGRTLPGESPPLPTLPIDPDSGPAWRMLGPFRGGRVDAATGVPGRSNELYFGAVNGGVWKTIDGGGWKVFDSGRCVGGAGGSPLSAGRAVRRRRRIARARLGGYGNGMYKSTDAGRTWTHIGLDDTQHIGKIAIDPTNPDIVFVAAIGHLYAANPDRGVFRSKDGGKSWQKVLFKNDDVGAVEVVIDPTNPRTVYAGLWNTRRPPWFTYAPTNGPGGGIYKSTDGGDTWKQLTAGLPKDGIGRTGIAVAPSHPQRVYAVVDLLPEPGAPVRRRRRERLAGTAHHGREDSSDRTTVATIGLGLRRTPRCGDAAGISRSSSSIPPIRTSCTYRTSRSHARSTAARAGWCCAARPVVTTTIRPGSRVTIPTRWSWRATRGASSRATPKRRTHAR